MAFGTAKPRRGMLVRAALAATLAVVFSAALVAADFHGHTHAPDACLVCHTASLAGLVEVGGAGLTPPVFLAWAAPADEPLAAPAAVLFPTPPRAPPA